MRREKNKQVKIKDMSSSQKLFNFLDNAIPQMNNYHSPHIRGVLLSQKDFFLKTALICNLRIMIKLFFPHKKKENTLDSFSESDSDVDSGSKCHSAIHFNTAFSFEIDLFSTVRRDCQWKAASLASVSFIFLVNRKDTDAFVVYYENWSFKYPL